MVEPVILTWGPLGPVLGTGKGTLHFLNIDIIVIEGVSFITFDWGKKKKWKDGGKEQIWEHGWSNDEFRVRKGASHFKIAELVWNLKSAAKICLSNFEFHAKKHLLINVTNPMRFNCIVEGSGNFLETGSSCIWIIKLISQLLLKTGFKGKH